jgi:predicted nucleic acid-binding Zn ribbon protein
VGKMGREARINEARKCPVCGMGKEREDMDVCSDCEEAVRIKVVDVKNERYKTALEVLREYQWVIGHYKCDTWSMIEEWIKKT